MSDILTKFMDNFKNTMLKVLPGNKEVEIDNNLENNYLFIKNKFNASDQPQYQVIFKSKNIEKIKEKYKEMLLKGYGKDNIIVLSRVGLDVSIKIKDKEDLLADEAIEDVIQQNLDIRANMNQILKERNTYKNMYEEYREDQDKDDWSV